MIEPSKPSESDAPKNNWPAAVGLIILLVILAGVAYVRVAALRQFVDSNAPGFKEKVGHYIVGREESTPVPAPAPLAMTLESLAAQPALWPKTVALKSGVDFVAVVNHEPVGTVRVPPGTEVRLMKISNGRLGLEYQGGGAWVIPQLTDLVDRVQPQVSLKL